MSSEADRGQIKLDGAGVLITRPLEQSVGMEAVVTASGGVAYVFPSLEITLADTDKLHASLARVQAGDVLIFISTNAVRGVFHDLSEELRHNLASALIAAVGERTQAALAAENLFVAIAPERKQQNSEGLLHHPLLQDLADKALCHLGKCCVIQAWKKAVKYHGCHHMALRCAVARQIVMLLFQKTMLHRPLYQLQIPLWR